MSKLLSWGRYPYKPQIPHQIFWSENITSSLQGIESSGFDTFLPFGLGRSYGDSCLAESGHVLAMRSMDRVLSVDWETGVVFAQAGLSLAELISIALPRGWFLPVTPGTKFVTLGGAVANDVHGKNHHLMGTFGRHVTQLVIERSDEGVINCSPYERSEIFAATIGGLGLTGVILAVKIQLKPIKSSKIVQRTIRFANLNEFFELSEKHDSLHEYSVAWIDCLASGAKTGRGLYILGDHANDGPLNVVKSSSTSFPFDPPVSLVNKTSLRIFNTFYYHYQRKTNVESIVEYNGFFYPLDRISDWNRIYGRAGFQQYQCVIPKENARKVINSIMKEISQVGLGSFLAVLKQFGELTSPGVMSFPIPGITLALDFPQKNINNQRLFKKLDAMVHEAGGRLYPAKDAHMSAEHFKQAYPNWGKVELLRDPLLLSSFWKRVTE